MDPKFLSGSVDAKSVPRDVQGAGGVAGVGAPRLFIPQDGQMLHRPDAQPASACSWWNWALIFLPSSFKKDISAVKAM